MAIAAAPAFAQYKIEALAAAPAGLDPAFAGLLAPQGTKLVSPAGSTVCEIWFRKSLPAGPKTSEESVVLPTIPHGSLLGVIRYPGRGSDRRGQSLKPGLYTLRYSIYPADGNHQGVAPQRDFLILTPAAEDKDASSAPDYEHLMEMSRKASGAPHPAILSLGVSNAAEFPSLAKDGESDWTLHVRIGSAAVALILVGTFGG